MSKKTPPAKLTPVCYTTPLFAVRLDLVWDTKSEMYIWGGDEMQGVYARVEVKQSTSCPSLWRVSGFTGCPGDTGYGRDFMEVTHGDNVAFVAEKFVLNFIEEAFENEPRAVQITTSISN